MSESVVSLDALLVAALRAHQLRPAVPLAIATLVDVEGSSFRQPGARLLMDAEGRCLAGAISGGCLEADVASRAAHVCASGKAQLVVYDLRDDLQTIWGFDAACDGVAHILIEPLEDLSWLEQSVALREQRQHGALLTIVEPSADTGSHEVRARTIGIVGSQEALLPGSTMEQTRCEPVGDECLHPAIATAARPLLHTVAETRRSASRRVHVDNTELRLFADPVEPPVVLHVIGAGRGAESFARIGVTMGWRVTIVDHRPAMLESLSLPNGVRTLHARPHQAADLVSDDYSAVALMTHIFDIDYQWLEALLPLGHAYVGVLGSRQRAQRLVDAITPAAKTRVHAPIGLDIGGESPESIALAAIAEIHAVMHARPGGFLRDRRSPIHDRTPVPASADPQRLISTASCRLPE